MVAQDSQSQAPRVTHKASPRSTEHWMQHPPGTIVPVTLVAPHQAQVIPTRPLLPVSYPALALTGFLCIAETLRGRQPAFIYPRVR